MGVETIVYDTSGKSYLLKRTALGGGEGKIYSIEGVPNLYAKIFNLEKRTRGRELKILEWERMFKNNIVKEEFLKQVVIPQKCLYSEKNSQNTKSFVGYLMERQSGFQPLDDVYTSKNYNYIQKVWTARNLCILTHLVHSMGKNFVIGDYNSNNIILFLSGSIAKLIDVDSIQMGSNKNGSEILLPTSVGVPEFLAPEIGRRLKAEKADLETVTQSCQNPLFNQYTDFYTLAYHLFYLLMNATPFATGINMEELAKHPSHTVSHIEVNRIKAAERGEFIFAKKIPFKRPQKVAANYQMLTRRLQRLFERAFIDGAKDPKSRPNAVDFYEALTEYLDSLEKRKCGHFMPAYYTGDCEWCRINSIKS